MSSFDDTTTTGITDPKDDKLMFLNGIEQVKYLRGRREYERNKSKVGSVIQYLKNKLGF